MARHLTLEEYREIRSAWQAGLRAIGLDPNRLPEDFCGKEVWHEMLEAGHPTQAELARRYNTSICTVSEIVRGRRLHRQERRMGASV